MKVRRDEKSEIEFYPNSNAYGREIVMSEDVRTDLTRLTNLVASKKHFYHYNPDNVQYIRASADIICSFGFTSSTTRNWNYYPLALDLVWDSNIYMMFLENSYNLDKNESWVA